LGAETSIADLNELLDERKVYAIDDMARKKLRGVIDNVKRGGEKAVLDFVDVLLRSLPQATIFTMSTLSVLLTKEDPYTPPDQEAEMSPPIDMVLKLAADRGSPFNIRARQLLSEAYVFYLEKLSLSEQVEVSFGNYLLETLMPRDYSREEKELLLEITFEEFGIPRPSNWDDFIITIIELEGQFFLSNWEGRPFLFPKDERPILVQVEEIEACFKAGKAPPTVIWKGEYPEPEEEPAEVVVEKVVVYQAPVKEMVEVTTSIVEEVVVESALPSIELEDSPELSVEERLYRFLKRLERRKVLRGMEKDEIWQMVEGTDSLWRRITPFGLPQRTHTFAYAGTKLLLKKLTRSGRPKRALTGFETPRMVLYNVLPSVNQDSKRLSDIRVDFIIAEDLVVRLALDENGLLVRAHHNDETTRVFLDEVMGREDLSNETQAQLETYVISCAHPLLIRRKRKDLVQSGLDVAKRARLIKPGAEARTTVPRRARDRTRPLPVSMKEVAVEVAYEYLGKPSQAQEAEIQAAHESGRTVIQRKILSKEEALRLRAKYGRGGLRKRIPVRGVGQAGGRVWLPHYLKPDGNEPSGFKLEPKMPSFDALERATAANVDLWMLTIIVRDPATGEEEVTEVFSTFCRASVRESAPESKADL